MNSAVPPRALLASLDAKTLGAAVERGRTWRQVLLALGLSRHRHVPALRALCEKWDIDDRHLRHRSPPDDLLREVLCTAGSWPEAMRRLGYAEASGSARETLRAHAVRLGLDVTPLSKPSEPGALPWPVEVDLRHLRRAGALIVAATMSLAGYSVSWPLEPAPYDLVVGRDGLLLRLQVKTTTRRVAGSWNCAVTRSEYADVPGGKRRARYDVGQLDAFAVVDGDGDVYLIPVGVVADRAALALGRFGSYRLPRLAKAEASTSSG